MSSPTPPQPLDFEAADQLIVAAVGTVAERSFFAFVDPNSDPVLDDEREWLVATLRFDDGRLSGRLACSVRSDLAQMLFDSFSGRHPSSPRPPRHEVDDLVGEFSNMVCGTWLSRCAGDRLFQLSRPVVEHQMRPAKDERHRHWVEVNHRPLIIDWEVERGPDKGVRRSSQ